jgi:hypothetical protein
MNLPTFSLKKIMTNSQSVDYQQYYRKNIFNTLRTSHHLYRAQMYIFAGKGGKMSPEIRNNSK